MKKVLKRIFIIILIVIVIFLAWKISLFVRANIIKEKAIEKLSNDFYIKITYNNGGFRQYEYWVTDSYEKEKIYILNENGEIELSDTTWNDKPNNISICVRNGEQIANIKYGENSMFIVPFRNIYDNYIIDLNKELLKQIYENNGIKYAISYLFSELLTVDSIKTEDVNGKECYAIKTKPTGTVFYVEKDTYVPVKNVNNDETFSGMNVEYECSFEPITKEMLDFPNLEEYYVIVD